MLKREMILLAFMGMIVLVAVVFRSDNAEETNRSLTVYGSGQSHRIADAVSIRFSIRGNEMLASDVEELFFNSESSLSFFDAQSIEIYVEGMNVYSYGNIDGLADTMNPSITYRLNLTDLEILDEVVAEIISFEGSAVDMSFYTQDEDVLVDEVREIAFEDARQQAEELAQMTGMSLGEVISISFSSGQGYGMNPDIDYSTLLAASEPQDLSFRPMPIQMNGNVTVTFEMH